MRRRPSTPPTRRLTALVAGTALASTGLGAVAAAGPAAADDHEAPDQIVNGTFDSGLTGWTAYPAGSVVDGRGCIDVPGGSGAYSAAITQLVPLVAGETYELAFTILSTPATEGNVRVVVQGGPDVSYTQFLPARKPALTGEPQRLSYTFTPEQSYEKAELAFQQDITNPAAYRVCVDDVTLTGGAEPDVYAPDTGPRVRVNQDAYLADGPKHATVVTESTDPLPWQLLDAAGAVVTAGTTVPEGVDPTAALSVHTVDLSGLDTAGTGYVLVADGETSHPFDVAADPYEDLRTDTMTFFYTNRSGIEISDELAPGYGRPAGHVGVGPNQGDTAVPCQDLEDDSQALYDEPWTCEGTRDVTGGWYDAGDHGKYVVNGGISVAQLLQTYERSLHAPSADQGALADGSLSIPESSNGVPDVLDEARWELEWMLKMQVPAGQPYAGLVNHKVADVDWTGLPLDPAADPQRRVLYRPSTAATLNLAAAAAQGARLWAAYDEDFARELLAAAETAYAAAEATPDLYAPAPDASVDPNPGSGPYDDDDVSDEFYWAAAELYITTGQQAFQADVQASPHHTGDVFDAAGFDWGHVAPLARLDLAAVPNGLPDRDRVRASVLEGADTYVAAQQANPFGQAYDPEGGVYAWGSNSAVLNNMVVLGYAYDISGDQAYADALLSSLDYLLGRNALNISYVTGYGDVYAENQHSRWYSASLDPSLPNPPAGTVSGGPNSTAPTSGDPVAGPLLAGCPAQLCYVDDIGSWSTNEITVNWNAPMAWVASFVADQDSGSGVEHASCEVTTDVTRTRGRTLTQVTVTSTGTTALEGLEASFSLTGGQHVSTPRFATATQQDERVTVGGKGWSRTVQPGGSVSVTYATTGPAGFASWAPDTVWVGDRPCTTG
ncbi:glycoside hydrolase family 9 protein [Aquipuribacter hungaricus]|uniref:Endoglucanase n=1 Tax=Aquipuribacter hungaricus TaxID=545624 RepID=A0ABV7WJ21_9MICO